MSVTENLATALSTTSSNLEANNSVSSRRPSLVQTRNHIHSSSVPLENSSKPKINRNNAVVSEDLSSSSSLPSAAAMNISYAKDEKKRLSAYEKLLYDSQHDMRFKAEEKAGRRIGFYRIRGDIGLGNFSRVKLGVHLLAKGMFTGLSSFPPHLQAWNPGYPQRTFHAFIVVFFIDNLHQSL